MLINGYATTPATIPASAIFQAFFFNSLAKRENSTLLSRFFAVFHYR